jgi:sigma-B regulation protein RsbU (phosphoserine phosphatase)
MCESSAQHRESKTPGGDVGAGTRLGQGTKDSAWRLEEWSAPAADPSGDFIICRRDGHRLRVFVGDATGHGEKAAAVAADVRRLIERDAGLEVSAELLRNWNREVDALHPDRFACLTYVEIDAATRQAVIANAGNPAVMIVRGRRGQVEQLQATGMPVGLVEDDFWVAPTFVRVELDAADSIVCFTDGLPDLLGPLEQRFGMERVLTSITRADDKSPIRSLGDSVTSFADRSAEQDDLTILCIERSDRRAA